MTDVASRVVAYLDDSTEPLLSQRVPAALTIDTHLLEDGDHVLRIEAWDQRGCKGVKRVPFSVRNGPSITLRGLEPHNVVEGRLALTIHAFAGAREEDWEPAHAETPAPVPTWVWVLLISVVAWAIYYLVAFWKPNTTTAGSDSEREQSRTSFLAHATLPDEQRANVSDTGTEQLSALLHGRR
jgi:hypothetical protein